MTESKYTYGTMTNKLAALGAMSMLARDSKVFGEVQLRTFVDICNYTIENDQYLIQTINDNIVGFVTWALVNDVTRNTFLKCMRPLVGSEFKSGPIVMIQDCVAVFGNGSELMQEVVKRHPEGTKIEALIASRGTGNPEYPKLVVPVTKDFSYKKVFRS